MDMKKLYSSILLFICVNIFMGVYSCDSYESEPLERIGEEIVFDPQDSLGTYAERFLNGIYSQLPNLHNRLNSDYLDSGTDDAVPSIDRTGSNTVSSFRDGTLSPGNVVDNSWKQNYTGIRSVNVFIENIHIVPLRVKGMKERWIAEARFLRAFFYFELVKRWGGVPLVGNEIFDLESDLNKPKASLNDCISYILQELDAIKGDLINPAGLADNNYGRATQGAAAALRSRILLYAASPLYNPEGTPQKWQDAADAAKAVIDMGVYSLHGSFKTLFYTLKNTEVIFYKEAAQNSNVELNNSPVGYMSASYKCKGFTSPSQSLVDAFLMKDGSRFDWNNSTHAANPYDSRDPRLDLTVFRNGYKWLNRTVETYDGGRDRPYLQTPQTRTGYYMRKFMGDFESQSNFANTHHSYMIFRYAEIYLNYVEALNEVDPVANKSEIEKYLFEIRKRAGITSGGNARYGLPETYTKAEMREIIHNERRIEMAFEEQRFWDIRRWKIAEDVMNKPVEGVNITKTGDNTYTYNRVTVQPSTFETRMYWFPVPRTEIQANTQLRQNEGWLY